MKKRVCSLILAMAMILSILPTTALARGNYYYRFYVHTSGKNYAGTDDGVYGGFVYYNGEPREAQFDTSSGNRFEVGTKDWCDFTLADSQDPWMIRNAKIRFGGGNAWRLGDATIYLSNADGSARGDGIYCEGSEMEFKNNGDYKEWDLTSQTRRTITSLGEFNTNWGGITYLQPSDAGKAEYTWDGMITDQYGTYHAPSHDDAPVMAYEMSNDGVGNGWFTFTPPNNQPGSRATLSIDKGKLLAAMGDVENGAHHGIGSLTFTVKLGFPVRSTNSTGLSTFRIGNGEYVGMEKTFTFNRNVFELGDQNISETAVYTPRTDYNYLNRQKNYISIKLGATSVHCGAITWEEKKELIKNFKGTAALYLGNSTSNKLCDLHIQPYAGTLFVQGTVPNDISGSLNDGVRLQLSNVSSTLSGKEYSLESGLPDASFYFSTHKVDTKAPTIATTNVDGATISIQNKIKQQQQFYLVSSETMYPVADVAHTDSNARFVRYELYQKIGDSYGASPVAITGYTGTGSKTQVTVPINTTVLKDAQITLKPANPTEGQYKLRVYGVDDANNGILDQQYYEIENVYLDGQAPRVQLTETPQNQAPDGSKRNDYTFAITDLQNSRLYDSWARTYYCFVKDGDTMPDPSKQTIDKVTGEIESVIGKWAFMEGGTAGASAILKVAKNSSFIGKLYYYTMDSAGNDSRKEQNNRYYEKDVAIHNYDSRDTLVTEEYTHPKKEYNISFDLADVNLKTEYHWVDKAVTPAFTQDLKVFTTGDRVGAGVQVGKDGKSYTLNGVYTLEYKVTETRSGNYKTFEKDYVFDNAAPAIVTRWSTSNLLPLQTQQVKVDITDMTGVKSAHYQVTNPDGSAVAGYEQTAITVTQSGDNKGIVNDTLTFTLPKSGVYGVTVGAADLNDMTSSKTCENFTIRAEKPEITGLNHNLSVLINGNGATADGNYKLTLAVTEPMLNAASLTATPDVRYCISTDGTTYGEWKTAADATVTKGADNMAYTFTVDTPYTLQDGLNTIYVKTACVAAGSTAVPSGELVSDAKSITLQLDNAAPTYDAPQYSTIDWTSEDVTIAVQAQDAGTGICLLSCATDGVTIVDLGNNKFTVTVTKNLTTNLTLKDSLGNTVLMPITVSKIDKEKPVTAATATTKVSGARTDGKITISVTDQMPTTVKFALIKDPAGQPITQADYDAFAAASTFAKSEAVITDNLDGTLTQTYIIDVRGISGTYAIGVHAADGVGHVAETLLSDAAMVVVDAAPEITEQICDPTTTKTTTTVKVKFNVPVAIMPNIPKNGRMLMDLDNEEAMSRTSATPAVEYLSEYEMVCTSAEEVTLYVKDECGRAYTLKFTPTATFIQGFDVTAHIEKNNATIANGGFISFTENDTLYYMVTPNPKYAGQKFYVDKAEYVGMKLNTEKSVAEVVAPPAVDPNAPAGAETPVVPPADSRKAYTTLCFEALHDGKTTKSVRFHSYTLEGNEADREEEEYLAIATVDESVPVGTVKYSSTQPTNQNVTATLTMSDAESGIIECQRSTDGGVTYEVVDATDTTTYEFSENGTVQFKLTNGAGMQSVVNATVGNIDKTPIAEGTHYTVVYTYENYLGEWTAITDGNAYRRVQATITPKPGSSKTLTATNNSGSLSHILTAEENQFTFNFKDAAGNVAEQKVEYKKYDNAPGKTTWKLSNTEKTNKNIFATITITDTEEQNKIVYAQVKKGDVVYPFTGEPVGNDYVVEIDSSGLYTVTAYDAAGNKWTEDITVSNINKAVPKVLKTKYSTPLGTVTSRSVLVEITEFDKPYDSVRMTEMAPVSGVEAKDIVYTPGSKSIRLKKNGSVAFKFVDDYGNEGMQIVTVSNICSNPPALEAVAKLADDQLSVQVTFKKQLNENGTPVDIYRELKDVNVAYGGITYKAENASFKLKNNGSYEFYVMDSSGATQKIVLEVTGIDDKAPIVKQVSWEYKYRVENGSGVWEEKQMNKTLIIGTDTSGTEAGYTVAENEDNPVTNGNVDVTVTTDKETTLVGGKDALSKSKLLQYRENGLYNFNMQAPNGTTATYGVDIQLIDKVAPVITLDNGPELIFIEGMTKEKDPQYAYDKAKLMDFHAYDMKDGKKIDLTSKVRINYGTGDHVFNPDDMSKNVFSRSEPYYVEYTVYDGAGNGTTFRRTIRLVGFYDTIALINGVMPDSTNVATVKGNEIAVSLKNFGGISYARFEKGIFTQGQMKTRGTSLVERNGVYKIKDAAEGWYTIYIQTDKRDYFNIAVYLVP